MRRGPRTWRANPNERAAFEWASMDVGARVYAMRETAGWSLDQLARAARMDPQTVADVENGRIDPHLSTLTRLFRALGRYLRALPEIPPDADPVPRRSRPGPADTSDAPFRHQTA